MAFTWSLNFCLRCRVYNDDSSFGLHESEMSFTSQTKGASQAPPLHHPSYGMFPCYLWNKAFDELVESLTILEASKTLQALVTHSTGQDVTRACFTLVDLRVITLQLKHDNLDEIRTRALRWQQCCR